jgi:hypothetical protein
MATLALTTLGSTIGAGLLPSGFLGISGAAIGGQLGGLLGSYVDRTLAGASGRNKEVSGPRLTDLTITASTEGAPIPRVYGQARLGGQIIWARDIEEVAAKKEAGGGGKGSAGVGTTRASRTTEAPDYAYFATFAVAIAAGEITGVNRIWADNEELDLEAVTWRLYRGTADQAPDTLIAAVEGAAHAPAYRGVAYVVFERLPLAPYGNRVPQLSFEIARKTDDFADLVQGIVLIPASGESVYAMDRILVGGPVSMRVAENVTTRIAGTNLAAAYDQLQAELPAVRNLSLTVAWFGDDLRGGHCTIKPKAENRDKLMDPPWSVGNLGRLVADIVSMKPEDGRPAYGGTPSDWSVVSAIREAKARGIAVTYTPFLLMDIPAGNTRPDPTTGAPGQPAYPWRGRISVTAANMLTAGARTEVAAFVGTARPEHFSLAGWTVRYTGPSEWSYRRFVLHQAFLCRAAGGVDAFVIGSEMRGLTTSRDARGSYPFVAELVRLAADVKTVLGPATKVTYAADWSEYFGHQPADGSGDVAFHLDPLWASPAIDAVGVDLYWPLADWRDGDHLDRSAGARSVYDLGYLKSNVAGGEGYHWYYASEADRRRQMRTPITDSAGKPWVFRYKDLAAWWSNRHYDRPGGVERATPTAWQPASKPVWFLEIGCPAVDKGANQPNVFFDPKSSESALPYFSAGHRDDLMQRRYVRALIEAYRPGHAGAVAGVNPISSVYGGPMVPPDRIYVYCWDARPYPAFPADEDRWGDAANWATGHWLSGRVTRSELGGIVATLLADMGLEDVDVAGLDGIVPGYAVDRIMSAREALGPLELAYFFDGVESGDGIRFQMRGATGNVATLEADDLVEVKPGADLLRLTRTEQADLPSSAKLTYLAVENDHRQAVAEARRLAGTTGRVAEAQLPVALDTSEAARIAESWLHETWGARERASFTLPPSRLAIEPGDLVTLETDGGARAYRITEIGEHGARAMDAVGFDAGIFRRAATVRRRAAVPALVAAGPPTVEFLDLPDPSGGQGLALHLAASLQPWPGPLAVYRSPENSGFELAGRIVAPAVLGVTKTVLSAGPIGRIDRAAVLDVEVPSGNLANVSDGAFFGGANTAAIKTPDGWEIIQFRTADLIAPSTWRLGGLLRGQGGTEHRMVGTLAAGARFLLLDEAVARIDLALGDLEVPYRWRIGPASRDIGHPDYGEWTARASGAALRPLSPVHVRARRDGGDLVVTWTRRTRLDGDGWALAEVPLGESEERYRIEVLSDSAVVRTVEVTRPRFIYPQEEQIADFGSPQTVVTLRIAQMSAVVGAGTPVTRTV